MKPPRNLPNYLTIARIVLALFLFVVLHAIAWSESRPKGEEGLAALVASERRLLLNVGLVIFVLAAISDVLDGQIARFYGLVSDFGRIADPFADKVVVSGAFLLLVPIAASGVSAWMVVIIVARESLVDGIRGFAEARGIPFPASFWGKTKMVLQSFCLAAILFSLGNLPEATWAPEARRWLAVATVVVTVFSGAVYLAKARTVLRAGALDEAGAKPEPAGAGR